MEAVKGIYHPDKLDAETFITNFTIRLKEFVSIIDNLKKQKKKPLQHFLITGKRGMGKSTLLRRLFLEAKRQPLSDKLIAVRLGSEQYKLSRLYKLWEEVINYLSLEDPTLNEKRQKMSDEKNYEGYIINIIVDYLNKQDKTLLLLIDNFDQFVEKLTSKEQHTFREILIQYPIQIIGNAIFYGEHFFKYDKAFFDFFKPIHLRSLDKNEAEEFIKQLAQNEGIENFEDVLKNQKGKIETLRILSGGVPRTLVILLSILSKRSTGDAIDYLNEMLEQVTPLYQDRMKALSPQQQEIMHHLAIQWDRTSARVLAKETRIPSKSISAQLSQLEDSGYINKISTSKRNHLYEIDERFFNIWLLMSESSAYDAKRVIWLTRWLDMFYDGIELEDYASYCSGNLKSANRFLIAQALSESEKLSRSFRDKLVEETRKELSSAIPEIKEWVMAYDKSKNKQILSVITEIKELIERENFEEALNKAERLQQMDEDLSFFLRGSVEFLRKDYDKAEQYYLMAVEKGNEQAMVTLGFLNSEIRKDYDKAKQSYLMAVEKGDEQAMFNLGFLYQDVKKDYDKAEQYYLMAVEKGDEQAMVTLGFLYSEIRKDYDKAEKYYLMAVEKGNETAMGNLGLLYDEIKKDYDKAEKYYLMAVEKGNESAMVNLGCFYKEIRKDYSNAETYYLMAVEKGNESAMFNLGILYSTFRKDYDKAEKYYLMAVEKGNESAMFNLGCFYKEIRKDYSNAETYYLMAVEKGNEDAINYLACSYYKKNFIDKKGAALNMIMNIESINSKPIFLNTKIALLLWNEKINESYLTLGQLLEKFLHDNNANKIISNSLICFLVFKQKHFLYRLFTENEPSLKDRFKPVYYALMQEMKKEFPDEYLKMTEEISEPVNDLLKLIKEERKRLGIG